MNKMFQHIIGVLLLCSYTLAYTDSIYAPGSDGAFNSEDSPLFYAASGEGRQNTIVFGGFNNTGLAVFAGLLLLGLATAAAVILLSGDDDSGYGNSGYHDSGYSDYHGRKFNPYGINWENLSILDWISMGQEAWEKYDASNIDCQKRLICEIHQNKSKFGGPANTMVQLFGYLHYAELLSLPDEVKIMLDEYMDASEKGKSMKKDCGEIFEACDFSVNGMLSKFSTNQI